MGSRAKLFLTLFIFLLVIESACRPKSSNQTELPLSSDTTALAQADDSGGFLGQDGLDYEPLNTGTYEQLPLELTSILNLKYPGWSLPYISRKHLKKADRNHSGPYYLQEDFNQDGKPDYAVQYFLKDTIFIKAYLKDPENKLAEYHLGKYPFTRLDEKEESKLYLSLLSKDKGIKADSGLGEDILPPKAIAVLNHSNSYLFYYDGKNFTQLKWPAEQKP